MNTHTLSVTIANYNNATKLPTALDTILDQSFQPKEIIIVDDCSTDNSIEIIESYIKKHFIIQLYKNEKNRGINHTLDRCFEHITGDYVYGNSGHDLLLPGFFEKSMKMLAQYPLAGMCTSLCHRVDDYGKKLSTVPAPPYLSNSPFFLSPKEVLDAIINKEFEIMSATSIFRVDILKEIGGLPHIKHYEDVFLFLICSTNYGICFIPEPLGQFLLSPNSGSHILNIDPEALMDRVNQTKQAMISAKYKKYFSPLIIQDFMARQRYLSGAIVLTVLEEAYKKSFNDIKTYALQNSSTSDKICFTIISFAAKTLSFIIKIYIFLRLRNVTWNIFLRVFYRIKIKSKSFLNFFY